MKLAVSKQRVFYFEMIIDIFDSKSWLPWFQHIVLPILVYLNYILFLFLLCRTSYVSVLNTLAASLWTDYFTRLYGCVNKVNNLFCCILEKVLVYKVDLYKANVPKNEATSQVDSQVVTTNHRRTFVWNGTFLKWYRR